MTFPDSSVLLQQYGYLIRTSLSGDEGIEEVAGGRVDCCGPALGLRKKRAETWY